MKARRFHEPSRPALACGESGAPATHSRFLLDISHPPAGATALIVSLGIISRPFELVIIEAAVFLLVAQALVINRLAGIPYPWWNAAASGKPVNESRSRPPSIPCRSRRGYRDVTKLAWGREVRNWA